MESIFEYQYATSMILSMEEARSESTTTDSKLGLDDVSLSE